jgi:hypothetical protein
VRAPVLVLVLLVVKDLTFERSNEKRVHSLNILNQLIR